jgi:hypothetical protein
MVDAQIRTFRRPLPTSLDLRKGIVLSGASEQMFFFGSPLAHVAAYEEWRRERRLWQPHRRQARLARHGGMALPPEPGARA